MMMLWQNTLRITDSLSWESIQTKGRYCELVIFFVVGLCKQLNKLSFCLWFKTPCSYNIIVILHVKLTGESPYPWSNCLYSQETISFYILMLFLYGIFHLEVLRWNKYMLYYNHMITRLSACNTLGCRLGFLFQEHFLLKSNRQK